VAAHVFFFFFEVYIYMYVCVCVRCLRFKRECFEFIRPFCSTLPKSKKCKSSFSFWCLASFVFALPFLSFVCVRVCAAVCDGAPPCFAVLPIHMHLCDLIAFFLLYC
jgi:hypothetical protein